MRYSFGVEGRERGKGREKIKTGAGGSGGGALFYSMGTQDTEELSLFLTRTSRVGNKVPEIN